MTAVTKSAQQIVWDTPAHLSRVCSYLLPTETSALSRTGSGALTTVQQIHKQGLPAWTKRMTPEKIDGILHAHHLPPLPSHIPDATHPITQEYNAKLQALASEFQKMTHLQLRYFPLTAPTLPCLLKASSDLRHLDLTGCTLIDFTPAVVTELRSQGTRLQTLILNNCFKINSKAIQELAGAAPHLTHVELRALDIENKALEAIMLGCRQLEHLDISFCRKINVLPALPNSSKTSPLRTFNCSDCPGIAPLSLRGFVKLNPSLTSLNMAGCNKCRPEHLLEIAEAGKDRLVEITVYSYFRRQMPTSVVASLYIFYPHLCLRVEEP